MRTPDDHFAPTYTFRDAPEPRNGLRHPRATRADWGALSSATVARADQTSHPLPSPEPIKPLILEPTTPYGARQARITM